MQIFIWGTGRIANQVLAETDVFNTYDVLGFIDNDLQKVGMYFKGKRVFSPDILNSCKPDRIVILTDSYEEIRNQIVKIFPEMKKLVENKNFFYRHIIIKRYKDNTDLEIKDILNYIQKRDLQTFNYEFVDKYRNLEIDVSYNSNKKMFYVLHENKKLYFARFLDTEQKVREYYRGLLIEQDFESPHKYLSSKFDIDVGDVVVDVGAAEGIFTLEIIERSKRVYLIEENEEWIDALKETFKSYQEKVIITQKYVTSIDEGKYATLDRLIDDSINFIKMDIEGNEWEALLGSENLINRSKKFKCAICSYHTNSDEILIKNILKKLGIKCSTTPGYMWWIPPILSFPYVSTRLRRGIVRGIK